MAQKTCWHYTFLKTQKILQFPNGWRNSHPRRLECLPAGADTLTAYGDSIVLLLDGGLLGRFQILLAIQFKVSGQTKWSLSRP